MRASVPGSARIADDPGHATPAAALEPIAGISSIRNARQRVRRGLHNPCRIPRRATEAG